MVRQYSYLLGLDGIDLTFEPAALKLIAKQSIDRKSGARGLRAIVENILMDTMFDLPSRTDVKSVIITEKAVLGKEAPKLVLEGEEAPAPKTRKPRKKTVKADESAS